MGNKNQKQEYQEQNLERELEREMTFIRNDLENSIETRNYEAIDEFLDDALDLIYHVDAGTKSVTGFDIGIAMGGPNINLEYSRGRCELIGAWGGAQLTMHVNNAVCEEILERLEELGF